MIIMKCVRLLLLIISVLSLNGCQYFLSDLTKVDLRLVAGGDLNLDDYGRPSPLVVKIFELKSVIGFENADFFSLYHHGTEVLGSDLMSSEELELKPGDVQDIKFALQLDSKYVAIMGAYRQLDKVSWRLVLPIQLRAKNDLTLLFGSQGIAMASTR